MTIATQPTMTFEEYLTYDDRILSLAFPDFSLTVDQMLNPPE